MFNSRVIYNMINLIETEKGKRGTFFSATNTTKDGSERVWNCRLGVVKFTTGGKLPYDPGDKNLLMVYSRKRKAYRSIKCDTLTRLQVCGIVLIENGQPTKDYEFWYGPAKSMDILANAK